MQPRMKNPALFFPEIAKAMMGMSSAVSNKGVPDETLELVHLRVSQINGCAWCLDYGAKAAVKADYPPEKLATLAGWRDSPYFDDAERAALALAEGMTRLADRPDPVPDEVWNEATAHYDELAMAALILWVSIVNVYNRGNVTTRQVAGTGF